MKSLTLLSFLLISFSTFAKTYVAYLKNIRVYHQSVQKVDMDFPLQIDQKQFVGSIKGNLESQPVPVENTYSFYSNSLSGMEAMFEKILQESVCSQDVVVKGPITFKSDSGGISIEIEKERFSLEQPVVIVNRTVTNEEGRTVFKSADLTFHCN